MEASPCFFIHRFPKQTWEFYTNLVIELLERNRIVLFLHRNTLSSLLRCLLCFIEWSLSRLLVALCTSTPSSSSHSPNTYSSNFARPFKHCLLTILILFLSVCLSLCAHFLSLLKLISLSPNILGTKKERDPPRSLEEQFLRFFNSYLNCSLERLDGCGVYLICCFWMIRMGGIKVCQSIKAVLGFISWLVH